MWDINTFYHDSTSLMKNLAQSCFSDPCPDHVYLSLVVIGAELKEEIYVWHTSHRRTDTVFTHLIDKPAVLTSVSPRANKSINIIQVIIMTYLWLMNYKKHEHCIIVQAWNYIFYLDGLVQDCSNTVDNALELLQSCTKPSISTDLF